ncbi:DNA-methyltransferase [Jeotgalibaca sp. A127]|uniref:DNA-methyltransferase n=1 Tax=Jeotgalibaca sp. A127 TaxID=3457324 RepID=UPI003FD3F64A
MIALEKAEKSKRNKTLATKIEEGQAYLSRCSRITEPPTKEQILNQTIIGDTFEVLPLLPKESVDLIIVDPPYNLAKNYHGHHFPKQKTKDYQDYTEKWLMSLLPVLKENGSLYVCCDWQSSLIIGPILANHLNIKNRITWQREKGRGSHSNWKNGMEDIWFCTKGEKYTFNVNDVKVRKKVWAPYTTNGIPKDWEETREGNFRDTHPSNFWDDITIPFWSMTENTAHPTQKSEKLIAKLILASSNPGDIVLDPFLGSGTTSVVAKKLGRKYIGIEQNERYCIWTEKRLEMANEDANIQGYRNQVFWERNTMVEQNKYNK